MMWAALLDQHRSAQIHQASVLVYSLVVGDVVASGGSDPSSSYFLTFGAFMRKLSSP